MDRVERLVNLVAALLAAERPLSRQELRVRVGGYAEEDEAFRRNFERDKDLLRQMGMPLDVEPLDPARPDVGDGYRITRERYELPDPGLLDDELAALRLAASAVAVGEGEGAATAALRKLAGLPGSGSLGSPAAGRGPTRVGGAVSVAELPADDGLAVLFEAVAQGRRVRFGYRGAPRELDPWRLSFRKGQWYLLGLDHGRGDQRLFRVDRIDDAPVAVSGPGAFTRPPGATVALPPPWQLGDEEETVASLLVDAEQADWATTTIGAPAVREQRADGSVLFDIVVTNPAGFRSFVLGFLDHAEVVGPQVARAEMVAWLEAIEQGVGAGTGPAPPPAAVDR